MLRPPLPPPGLATLDAYRILVHEIDQLVDELCTKRFSELLHCRPGCSECCIPFSILPLEARLIADTLPAQDMFHNPGETCCLLTNNKHCLIYEQRPVICRTQGIPIGYVNEETEHIEVSACALNFPDDYCFTPEDILFLDRFNQRLAELNLQYCRKAGLEPHLRIPISLLPGLSEHIISHM